MTHLLNRRRFLCISAAISLMPAGARGEAAVAEWRGIALGAGASLRLVGVEIDAAREIFHAVEAELSRLESIFSLFRKDSALALLNRTGRLDAPPPDLLELLTLSGAVHDSTGGMFDPTVQPLWALYAEHAGIPDVAALSEARGRVGWKNVRVDEDSIRFDRPGMALTLNGIAQGYITDCVARLLRSRGMRDVLVDMGEIAGLGRRSGDGPWRVGISAPDGRIVERVTLSERALATSAPLGTVLDTAGSVGHILDPYSGKPVTTRALASVTADRAALADALSTAFCGMDRREIDVALKDHPSARLAYLA
ncbi:MAG: FAD:protein FMN transferase [Paracoccaceae bacterium]